MCQFAALCYPYDLVAGHGNSFSMAYKSEIYRQLFSELQSLLEGERDFVANMANCAAVVFQNLPDVNWAGFYLLRGSDLVLGPFQGKPACRRIAIGRGVCGAAAL